MSRLNRLFVNFKTNEILKWVLEILAFILFIFAAKYIQYHSPYLYHQNFAQENFSQQIPYKLYIAFYLIYLSAKAGMLVSNYSSKKIVAIPQNSIDVLLISITLGLCAFQIIFFILGIFGLLHEWIIFLFFFLIAIYQSKSFDWNLKKLIDQTKLYTKMPWWRLILQWSLLSVSIIYIINVGLTKAQIPIFNDFVHHYGQYFIQTANDGKIQPNDVWYQFFYSKGDSISIVIVKLTDITGKLLISFVYFVATILVLARIIFIATSSTLLASLGVCLLCLIIFFDNTQSFEKQHIAILFTLGCTSYLFLLMPSYEEVHSKVKLALYFLTFSIGLLSTPSLIYLNSLFIAAIIYGFLKNNFKLVKEIFCLVIFSLGCCVLILLFNYFATGLLEITPFRTFLPYIKYSIFSNWVSPYLVSYLEIGSNKEMGKFIFNNASFFDRLYEISRIKILTNFISIYVLLPVLGSALFLRNDLKKNLSVKFFIVLLSVSVLVFTLLSYLTVTQPLSVYRATQFIAFYTCLIIIVGVHQLKSVPKLKNIISTPLNIFIFTLIFIPLFTFIPQNSTHDLRLSFGKISLDNYYYLNSPPNTSDGFYLIKKLRDQIGYEQKILSLDHSASFGRYYLVGNGLITEVSYSLGPKWHILGFGNPEISKNELRSMGINYFILNIHSAHVGLLPYSELFNKKNINKYFDVISSEGDWRALTWANNQGREKLSTNDLTHWDNAINAVSSYKDLFTNLKQIFIFNDERTDKGLLLPQNLQEAKGWQ